MTEKAEADAILKAIQLSFTRWTTDEIRAQHMPVYVLTEYVSNRLDAYLAALVEEEREEVRA